MAKLLFGPRTINDFTPLKVAAESFLAVFPSPGVMLDWLETALNEGKLSRFARCRTEYVNAPTFDEGLGEEVWMPTHALEPATHPDGGFYQVDQRFDPDIGALGQPPRFVLSKSDIARSRATVEFEQRPDRSVVYTDLYLLREEVAFYADRAITTTEREADSADKAETPQAPAVDSSGPVTALADASSKKRKRGRKSHRWGPFIKDRLDELDDVETIHAEMSQEDVIDMLDLWAGTAEIDACHGPRPSRSKIRDLVKEFFDKKGW